MSSKTMERATAPPVETQPVMPPPTRVRRPWWKIRWIDWSVPVVLVVAALVAAIVAGSGEERAPQAGAPIDEAESGLVAAALTADRAAVPVPEFVGLSGGNLPVVESSPLTLGPRHFDPTVVATPEFIGESGTRVLIESTLVPRALTGDRQAASMPEFVGQSGGDAPVVESSPLVLGARHLDPSTVIVPEFVGESGVN